MAKVILTLFVSALLTSSVLAERAPNYEKETSMTAREANALAQFKKFVIPKIPKDSQLQKYIGDDLFFIRWLRATNLDINAADALFTSHLKWRESDNIDQMHKEDWSDMEREFKIFNTGVDKYGQPVTELWLADWPTRTAMIGGKGKRLGRWFAKMFEDGAKRLYEGRQEGKELATATLLVGLEGFNILQHGCVSCLPIYLKATDLLEKQYPYLYSKIELMNMPPSFELVLNLVRPVMRANTRQSLKSYSTEDLWAPVLDKVIPKEERSVKFGGTIKRGDH